ncbi:AI-2E family transporter [Thalassiella azotivora]
MGRRQQRARERKARAERAAATTDTQRADGALASTGPADAPATNAAVTQPALPRAVVVLLGLAAAVLVVAGMRSVADIVAPTFLALTLVITVHPLQRWMVAHRVPRWVATLTALLLLWLLLVGLITSIGVAVAQLAVTLPRYSRQFQALYTDATERLADLGVGGEQIQELAAQVDVGSVFGFVQGFLNGLLGATSTFVFLLTVLVFLVMDSADVPRRLELAGVARPDVVDAMYRFARGVRSYWLVSTVFGLIVAVLDVIALYWLGVPLALLWGLLSFITNYIPNIGFVLGLVPPALLGLLEGGVGTMIGVIAAYSALNVVVQTIIQPKFTGDAVGLTVTMTFLSLVFWAWVLGPLGALLALPMTLFVKSLLVDADPRARWLNALISSNPHVAPDGSPQPVTPAGR